MKILLDRKLKPLVHAQLNNAMASDSDANRRDVLFEILSQFVRSGEAERYVRPDGRIGWRASLQMLERLAEEEMEYDFND